MTIYMCSYHCGKKTTINSLHHFQISAPIKKYFKIHLIKLRSQTTQHARHYWGKTLFEMYFPTIGQFLSPKLKVSFLRTRIWSLHRCCTYWSMIQSCYDLRHQIDPHHWRQCYTYTRDIYRQRASPWGTTTAAAIDLWHIAEANGCFLSSSFRLLCQPSS